MPRTIAVETPGCPPIRALTFDVLGLIKVIEGRSSNGAVTTPKVVEKWGQPEPSRAVVTASLVDRQFNPLLAVARKNGQIELLNPLDGEVFASETPELDDKDSVVGLHLFRKERSESSSSLSRSCTLLTCTMKGNATIRSMELTNPCTDSTTADTPTSWSVCKAGDVLFSSVDGNEKYGIFGGKGIEVNMWDLDKCSKMWAAKSPPKNSLGIFTPTWFTAATFLSKEDHRKIVAGTNDHQVRLYDISAQRRPVISFDFRESSIKAITEDLDGHTIYLGTGSGDLASVDMRTGKLLGCFLGKCSGSIRSIARHPVLPVIASCGLDSYLRIWDIKTRQLLSAVFLKQHLTNVLIDSNFSGQETAGSTMDPTPDKAHLNENEAEEEDAEVPVKRKKSSKESKQNKKLKLKKKSKKRVQDEDSDS